MSERNNTYAEVDWAGRTIFGRHRWHVRLMLGGSLITTDAGPFEIRSWSRAEMEEKVRDLLGHYMPPQPRSIIVRPRGWRPTVGPQGPGGA